MAGIKAHLFSEHLAPRPSCLTVNGFRILKEAEFEKAGNRCKWCERNLAGRKYNRDRNARTAKAFNDSGVFKPFTVVGGLTCDDCGKTTEGCREGKRGHILCPDCSAGSAE